MRIQFRSFIEAYAGAAHRRVRLVTVLLRPPSGHRSGSRKARHGNILQILRLSQPRSIRAAPWHGPTSRIPTKQNPMGGFFGMHPINI